MCLEVVQKVSSLYASKCFQGDALKNAFFQKLSSDLYIYIQGIDARGRENGGNSHDRNFKDRDLNDTAF